ncbi:MAG: signal peptidase II [Lachnospiraceae bacterium]|jgi:signal peptidase II|nr:signal peptidase II [Lachnospiraceae bacterium]
MEKRWNYNMTGILAAAILTGIDQWTKYLAVLHLKDQAPFVIWEGVFELHYLENRGAAFGILQGKKIVFVVCTLLVLGLIAFYYNRTPRGKRFHPVRVIGVLLVAGAIGNMIDRICNSYVVDFLYFKLIDFPIFNVADCYVTVGAIIMALLFLFFYQDEEMEFLNPLKKLEG